MKISFDSKNDVMRIKFQKGKYDTSKEIEKGIVIDMTKDNKIIAIEILDFKKRTKNLEDLKISLPVKIELTN